MKTILLLALLASPAAAQTPNVQHAAETVAHLHDTMLDPASFVLDSAFVTKPDKKGRVSFCYAYRSHNTMGGYSEGRAVEWALDNGKLSTYTEATGAGFPGYDAGWIAPCKDKNVDTLLTDAVKALAPSLYKKDK